MASSEETAKGVAVVGIDPVEENLKSSLSERVIKGEYLRPDDDGVIVGKRLSEFLQIEVGDTLALMGQGYHGSNAIGLFPVRGIADLMFPEVDNGALYMSIPAAQYFVNMPDGYSGLLVAANEGADLTGLCQRISTLVDTASVEVLPWQIVMEDLVIQSQANDVFRQIIKFILYAIVGFGILGTVIMMTNERKHEFGGPRNETGQTVAGGQHRTGVHDIHRSGRRHRRQPANHVLFRGQPDTHRRRTGKNNRGIRFQAGTAHDRATQHIHQPSRHHPADNLRGHPLPHAQDIEIENQ